MDTQTILKLLKMDLMIMSDQRDDFLLQCINAATAFIEREGVTIKDSVEDTQLIVMYAAYMYRQRTQPDTGMPRMLRWALNNRLFSQEAQDG